MKTILTILAVAIATIVCSSASAEQGTQNQEDCIEKCNTKWTKEFLRYKDVEECKNYVRHQALICIGKCE